MLRDSTTSTSQAPDTTWMQLEKMHLTPRLMANTSGNFKQSISLWTFSSLGEDPEVSLRTRRRERSARL